MVKLATPNMLLNGDWNATIESQIDGHKEARKWLCENMRILAIIDLPPNIFAEAGVVQPLILHINSARKN